MTGLHNLQDYGRFLAARVYTSVGSEDMGIAAFDVAEPNPATQEETRVVAPRAWPPHRVKFVKLVSGADAGWTVLSVAPLRGDSGQAVSDALERARAETEKQLRLVRAIEDLATLAVGWAGEGSVAPSDQAIKDARLFISFLPEGIPEPTVCAADDGEILIDWAVGNKKAVVGFEGDGRFGYALYQAGWYKPGNQDGDLSVHDLPSDFKGYLKSMKEQ
jgi:hypothetical protein